MLINIVFFFQVLLTFLYIVLWNFILLYAYEIWTFPYVYYAFKLYSIKIILFSVNEYKALTAYSFTVHRSSEYSLNQQILLVCGRIPHSIYFLWLRWLSTMDVFVKSGRWRLVAVAHCSPPSCVRSHIHSIWQALGSRKIRQWKGKVGTLPSYKCPEGLLLWWLRQFRGEVVGRWWDSVTQMASLSQKETYQSHSKCQTGPRPQRSFASSSERSQRCSLVGRQGKQAPVDKVSQSLNTPQMSERESLAYMSRKTPVWLQLCV